MSSNVCRVGDLGIGVCSAHPAPIPCIVTLVSGATTAKTNGLATAISTTVGISSCGHASIAISFSSISKSEGCGQHRVGDVGALPGGIYTMITGSPNSRAG